MVIGASLGTVRFLAKGLPAADAYEELVRGLPLLSRLRSVCLGLSELLEVRCELRRDRRVLTQCQDDGTELIRRGFLYKIHIYGLMMVARAFTGRRERCLGMGNAIWTRRASIYVRTVGVHCGEASGVEGVPESMPNCGAFFFFTPKRPQISTAPDFRSEPTSTRHRQVCCG